MGWSGDCPRTGKRIGAGRRPTEAVTGTPGARDRLLPCITTKTSIQIEAIIHPGRKSDRLDVPSHKLKLIFFRLARDALNSEPIFSVSTPPWPHPSTGHTSRNVPN